MQTEPDTARLTVDLNALAANHAACVRKARGAEVAPVVKADAYGLGVGPVARRLWTEGARSFFVARLAEGADLRAALGTGQPAVIYVLDGCTPGTAGTLGALDLTPVLNSLPQVEAWAAHARARGQRLPAALHVDTGLNRLGLRVEEAEALVTAPDRLAGLDIGLVLSHLACAETPDHAMTARQIALFDRARALFPEARASLDNSAGLFGGGPALDMVRPGIALYGGGPRGETDSRLLPVVTLTAPVLQVRGVPAGESVGYGAAFTAPHPMRVAIVAAGYADGLLRAAAPRGYGWARGARRPFLGRISMDLIALDVTEGEPVRPGDPVELLGPHVPLDGAADAAGTIAYELLTRIGTRVTRTYVGAGA